MNGNIPHLILTSKPSPPLAPLADIALHWAIVLPLGHVCFSWACPYTGGPQALPCPHCLGPTSFLQSRSLLFLSPDSDSPIFIFSIFAWYLPNCSLFCAYLACSFALHGPCHLQAYRVPDQASRNTVLCVFPQST